MRCRAKNVYKVLRYDLQCTEPAEPGESLCWLHRMSQDNGVTDIDYYEEPSPRLVEKSPRGR